MVRVICQSVAENPGNGALAEVKILIRDIVSTVVLSESERWRRWNKIKAIRHGVKSFRPMFRPCWVGRGDGDESGARRHNASRVKFLPLAWAGMPKTKLSRNSDSPHQQYFGQRASYNVYWQKVDLRFVSYALTLLPMR
ncbi:MAG: hypothetical protein H0A75_01425 [Candidatus Methanofishera endochildressiae]|uniref:Uncharacterized protein n=1 Tax=Candidatus Methanofishera endochildressiae TaxID=2738884 RepID=A0A7Z0MMQ1_9GAMM|nr:hypothetical protein [Candidatus Methanofishera endochildressiae]